MPRILLVEDEPGLVLTLTDRLTAEGYDVTPATDGEQGYRAGLEQAFDLMILDVMLPKKMVLISFGISGRRELKLLY